MVFFIYILFSLLPNTFDLSVHGNLENNGEYFCISHNTQKSISNQLASLKINLSGNNKARKLSKYLKRKHITRHLAICSLSCTDSNNHYRLVVNNANSDSFILYVDLHPNSLRAPPAIYCM